MIKRINRVAIVGKEAELTGLEGMKIDDIINAGERSVDDAKVAELILKKSGRKNKKTLAKAIKENPNTSKKTKETIEKIEKTSKFDKSIFPNLGASSTSFDRCLFLIALSKLSNLVLYDDTRDFEFYFGCHKLPIPP